MEAETFYLLGLILTFTGLILTLLAIFYLSVSRVKADGKGRKQVNGGGAIILGPFPIVFGTDKKSTKTVLVLSIVLTLVAVVFYLLSR